MPSPIRGAAHITSSQLRSVSAPISQLTICPVAKGVDARLMTSAVNAPASDEITTPASVNTITLPLCPAMIESSSTASAAPASAKPDSTKGVAARPKKIETTAPSAAVAETPNRPGSASGLRRYPCIAAPAMPSPPPISSAAS